MKTKLTILQLSFKHLLLFIISILSFYCLVAQPEKTQISLKDSLDRAFDLSDYIINANGFVPIPYIITEPALGGFGGLLAPVFLKKRAPYIDSVRGERRITPVAPDITGGLAGYTLNNTWLLAGFRSGSFKKARIKYLIGVGYANVNMSFYMKPEILQEEKELKFNIKGFVAKLQAIKKIAYSNWYAGLNYTFMSTEVKYTGDTRWEHFADSLQINNQVSQPGIVVELDKRDNVFTPDKGIKFHVEANCSDEVFGSDFDFWRFNYYTYMYLPLFQNFVGGLRIDGQQIAGGDPPFYLKPYIDMRGVPAVRYQGNADILSELELRWDFTKKKRWSLVGFSGAGKAFDEWQEFRSADWIISYGAGFRYLLARKFKLRMGIDLAHSPDTWAYYIVFGSSWSK